MTDPIDDTAEKYIRSLTWSAEAKDYEKALVAGNIRGFYAWLKNQLPAPAASREYIVLNLAQAQNILEFFGGDDTSVTVEWFDKRPDEEGGVAPAGLYAYCTEYPEEGCVYLDPDEPPVVKEDTHDL